MIQFGLYFALGFLVAGFLALLVAPSIWRRAVFLTRKRIESAIPLTANELLADKDKLRAEHAMALHKLNFQFEKQREKATALANNLAAREAELKELEEKTIALRANEVERLAQLEEMKQQLSERENEQSDLALEKSTIASELMVRTGELDTLSRIQKDTENRLMDSRKKVEELEEQNAKLAATIAELQSKRIALDEKLKAVRTEGKETAALLKTERNRVQALEKTYEKLVSSHADIEDKLMRREKELARLREHNLEEEAGLLDLESRLVDAETERHELDKELSDLTLRYNLIAKALGSDKPEEAAEEISTKFEKLTASEKALRDERAQLKKQLSLAANTAKPVKAPVSENNADGDAILREQLKQLAAQVVHMTALVEGKNSRINDLLNGDVGDEKSLAARIQALQQAAATAKL